MQHGALPATTNPRFAAPERPTMTIGHARLARWRAALDAMRWPRPLPERPLIGLACVRNECDIIEAFVRHNLGLLDGLVIIDNAGTDTTVEILRLLREESLPILLVHDPGLAHSQGERMTDMANLLAASFGDGYLFLLDADEFIVDETPSLRRTLAERLGSEHVGALRWRTYVPTNDGPDALSPIARIRHRRVVERFDLRKVVLPMRLLVGTGLRVAEGNHLMRCAGGTPFPQMDLDSPVLAHYPVRSEEQLVSKIVVGWLSVCLYAGRRPGNSWHWKQLFDEVKETWTLSPERLQAIASGYSDSQESAVCLDPIGGDGEICRYPDLAGVDLRGRIENFAGSAAQSLGMSWTPFSRSATELRATIRQLEEAATREAATAE
jgi:hypothetical protein